MKNKRRHATPYWRRTLDVSELPGAKGLQPHLQRVAQQGMLRRTPLRAVFWQVKLNAKRRPQRWPTRNTAYAWWLAMRRIKRAFKLREMKR